MFRPGDGVDLTGILPAGKLLNVAVQVLCAHVVTDTDATALHQAPELLHVVRVRHFPDMLPARTVHAFVIAERIKRVARPGFIRADL